MRTDLPDFLNDTMRALWIAEYGRLAGWLAERLDFQSAADYGCGAGHLLAKLQELGAVVWGFEQEPEAIAAADSSVAGRIHNKDVGHALSAPTADLIICTEVAEHLHASRAHQLVRNLARCCDRWLLFSAARPGQGGSGHVNEQGSDYWLGLLSAEGLELDADRSCEFREWAARHLRTQWWIGRNAMILRPVEMA